jgi:hypothetical protein
MNLLSQIRLRNMWYWTTQEHMLQNNSEICATENLKTHALEQLRSDVSFPPSNSYVITVVTYPVNLRMSDDLKV